MTTDLKDMAIEELVQIIVTGDYCFQPYGHTRDACTRELARRLEEALKKIEHITCPCGISEESRETRAVCSAGTCYGCIVDRLREAQHRSEAHDAEVAAKALEEAKDIVMRRGRRIGGAIDPVLTANEIESLAAEYRAKAGRKE